jgi:surface antigen
MKVRRWRNRLVGGLCVLVGLGVAGTFAASAGADATITVSGTVVCNSGRPVVGVWLTSSNRGSGWASWTPMPGRANVAWYSRRLTFTGASTTVEPHVGCGRTPATWGSTSIAPPRTVSSDRIYNIWCNDPASGTGRSCSTGALPGGLTYNQFVKGYCTWGAAALWFKATGKYPSWRGNAKDWAVNAGALKFTISPVPHPRSIVVFPANVGGARGDGHVAWVTRVWVSAGVVYMHIREMNWGQLNVWHDRDIRYDSRYRFIVAPPGKPVNA